MNLLNKLKSKKKTIGLLFLVILAITLPVSLSLTKKSQDIRQRATSQDAPTKIIKVAVILYDYDFIEPTPNPTKIPPLTPYPTFIEPTIDSSLPPKPTNPPFDPVRGTFMSPAVVKNILEGNDGYYMSPNAFYGEIAAGKYQFTYDYFGWFHVSLPPPTSCDIYRDMSVGDKVALANGVDLSSFQTRVYVTNFSSPCDHPAFGGKDPGKSYSYAIMFNSDFPPLYSHELGHALNLGHANTWECKNRNDYTNDCQSIEYGDPYDIMGLNVLSYLSTPHQITLGLLLDSEIQTVNEAGNYSIVPIEIKTAKKQALKILKRDTTTNICNPLCNTIPYYYYVEYRQPIGMDSAIINSPNKEGLIIHIWDGNTSWSVTNLVNPQNPVIHDGESFYDKINDIRVTLVSHNADSANINVQVGPDSLTPKPTPTPIPTHTPIPDPCSACLAQNQNYLCIDKSSPIPHCSNQNESGGTIFCNLCSTLTSIPTPPTSLPPTLNPSPTVSPQLSQSPVPTPSCDPNGDGNVDLLDFQWWKDEYLGVRTTKLSSCFVPSDPDVTLLDFQAWKNIAILKIRR